MTHLDKHPLWGSNSPLSNLSFVPFIVCASMRFSIALVSTVALLWTYLLTGFTLFIAKGLIPRTFKPIIPVFLGSFWTFVFAILLSMFSPPLFHELLLPLALVPVVFMISGLDSHIDMDSFKDAMNKTILYALILGAIVILLSLIREPLGFGALSLPTKEGITELLTSDMASDWAIQSFAATSGGLILLGLTVGFYRIFKEVYLHYRSEKENQ